MDDREIEAAIDAACTRVRRALVSLSEGALEEYDSDGIPVVIPKTRELLAAAKEEMREACAEALYRATPLASGCMEVVRQVPVTADKFLAKQIAQRAERIAELEAWQLAVAEHLGFVNRPEGQAGYEVADAETVIGYIRGVEKRVDVLEDTPQDTPTPAPGTWEYERGELLHRVADLTKRVETAHLEALSRERIISTLERTLDGPTGLRARFAQKSIESEARYDCHAGPGTTTPACGACVSCLHRTLTWVEAEKDKLAIRVSVLDGSACAEERAEGNGGCGMCAWCCKSALERAETAEIANVSLSTRLKNAEAVAGDELEDLECIPCAQLSGHAEPCVRGPVLRVLQALRERKP